MDKLEFDKTNYRIVNGKKVYFTDEERNLAIADSMRVVEREYSDYRKEEYPKVGDQLDAILKQLNYMRLNGVDMVADMDAVLSQWLSVKAKYPKPE